VYASVLSLYNLFIGKWSVLESMTGKMDTNQLRLWNGCASVECEYERGELVVYKKVEKTFYEMRAHRATVGIRMKHGSPTVSSVHWE